MNTAIRESIIKAIIKGVQRNGERWFSLSQDYSACYVPVDSGNLRRSGIIKMDSEGYFLGYLCRYAAAVENGIPRDIPITGDQIIHMKNGKTRILHNKRVIFIRRKKLSKFSWIDLFRTGKGGRKEPGIFVTISKIKARPGQKFLYRSGIEAFKKLPDDIIAELKRERSDWKVTT